MPFEAITACIAAFLLAANAAFQLALSAGIRWGHAAYGGKAALDDGSLPTRYRVMSLVSALFMGLLGWVVLAGGGVVGAGPMSDGFVTWACRGAAVLFALNTVGNLTSLSKIERWVMGSTTICLTVLFGLIGWLR